MDLTRISTTGVATGSCKRARVSEHIKTALLDQAATGRGAQPLAVATAKGSVTKQDCGRWLGELMNVQIASATMAMRGPKGVISHVGDAGRVGKPALDLFLATAWVEDLGASIEYAPAVSREIILEF